MTIGGYVMFYSVGHFGWSERGSGERWKTVEEVVERVPFLIGLVDVIDAVAVGISIDTNGNFRPV